MCGLGQNGTQEPPALSFLTPLFGPVVCDPVASLLGQQASAGTLDHPPLQILGELVPRDLAPLWVQETSVVSGSRRCSLL